MLNTQVISDLGSDPDRTWQYLELLRQDIEEELQNLQSAIDGDDRNRLGQAAHTLKGLCGHLANPEPAEMAAWLQQHASATGAEKLQLVIGALRTLCQQLLAQENIK